MPRRKSTLTEQIHADHWDNHEVVVIRSFNTEDEEFINDGLAGLDEKGNPKIYAGRAKRLNLQRGIVSWTFTDAQGRPLPLGEASIKALAPEDSQFIFEKLQALNAPMSAEEKKGSSTSATPGIEESPAESQSQR